MIIARNSPAQAHCAQNPENPAIVARRALFQTQRAKDAAWCKKNLEIVRANRRADDRAAYAAMKAAEGLSVRAYADVLGMTEEQRAEHNRRKAAEKKARYRAKQKALAAAPAPVEITLPVKPKPQPETAPTMSPEEILEAILEGEEAVQPAIAPAKASAEEIAAIEAALAPADPVPAPVPAPVIQAPTPSRSRTDGTEFHVLVGLFGVEHATELWTRSAVHAA